MKQGRRKKWINVFSVMAAITVISSSLFAMLYVDRSSEPVIKNAIRVKNGSSDYNWIEHFSSVKSFHMNNQASGKYSGNQE